MAAKPTPKPKPKKKGLNDFLKEGKTPPSKNKKGIPSDADVRLKGYNDKKTISKVVKKTAPKPTLTPKPKPKKTKKPELFGAGDPNYIKKMKEQGRKEREARKAQQQGFIIE
jgi:hypothetical protein